MAEGSVSDMDVVAERIRSLLAERQVKLKDVASSVAGHAVIVKRVPMSAMSDEELIERLPEEAARHIPFDVSEVNLRFQVIDTDGPRMDVLLVAVKKDKIADQTGVFEKAGRTLRVLDVDVFALQNCFEANYEPDDAEVAALLNIGASLMNISIVRGGMPLFTRDVSMAGNQITEAIEKEMSVTFEVAERLKTGAENAGAGAEQRAGVLRSVSETLALEVQKTFDFFRASAGGESVEKMYVTGGTARLDGLLDVLREEFSLPVEALDPFRGIQIPGDAGENHLREMAPQLSIAAGLAMRSFDTP
jgi:type IV pilus assembly protein PilM